MLEARSIDIALENAAAGYAQRGYAVLRGLLPAEVVRHARAVLTQIIDTAAAGGGRSGLRDEVYGRDVAPSEREHYVQFETAAGNAPVLDRVRKVMNFQDREPFASLLADGGAVATVAAGLLGPAPILLHCLAQLKPPRVGREKGWHQDTSYFSVVPIDAVLGIWVALDHAHDGNGCLEVLPGGHLQGPLRHEHAGECRIPPAGIDPARTVPVVLAPGDAVAFNGLLPHGSKANTSGDRRWALTFHFRGAQSLVVSNREFDAVFVDAHGEPAGCAAAAARASPEAAAQWGDAR